VGKNSLHLGGGCWKKTKKLWEKIAYTWWRLLEDERKKLWAKIAYTWGRLLEEE
jgi:hypothetical protein